MNNKLIDIKEKTCIVENCFFIKKLKEENIELRNTVAYLLSSSSKKRMNRTNKYNAKKITIDGIKFDSIKESKRYCELKLLQKAGEVLNFITHPSYDLKLNNKRIKYIADFGVTWKNLKITIEDVKGLKTASYRIKKALMKKLYNIDIVEL